ncbi:hypothetical protein EUGRSUZ_D01285 [Eucalyptus grandis]|uniref:Uncharacterized protein n=2 Tax=Eucalyptus grandis TaxID=71139 RepID=A0ACC3L5R1_EUCGR|nr:hypothetical protein EUGRSUZ_D01285 [Eucalyptus grandis]
MLLYEPMIKEDGIEMLEMIMPPPVNYRKSAHYSLQITCQHRTTEVRKPGSFCTKCCNVQMLKKYFLLIAKILFIADLTTYETSIIVP